MPLSIFNSNREHAPVKPAIEIVLLLCIVGAILVGIESATRILILPKSKIERRTKTELDAAAAIRNNGTNHTLLLLGNSLLGQGVEMQTLSAMLPPGWNAKRLLIEDTGFYDWYFGMRHLFSIGSHPDTVVLMLSVKQLTSTGVRGEYFASRLMNLQDLPDIRSDLQLHLTATTGLLTGNLSAFYGTRVEIRKQVLGLLIPDLVNLTKLLVPSRSAIKDEALLGKELRLRFIKLRQLSLANSIRMAVLIAPESGLRDETLKIALGIAVDSKLDVLVPLRPGKLNRDDFSDGFHLNAVGAAKFTKALAEVLQCYLANGREPGAPSSNRACKQILCSQAITEYSLN
jgi:hypothetical protein